MTKMQMMQNGRRIAMWTALGRLFGIGQADRRGDSASRGNDKEREVRFLLRMDQPEIRIPYDFNRIRGPGGVR